MAATTTGNHFDKVRYDHVRGNDARAWEQVIVTICFVRERLDVMVQQTQAPVWKYSRMCEPASKRASDESWAGIGTDSFQISHTAIDPHTV